MYNLSKNIIYNIVYFLQEKDIIAFLKTCKKILAIGNEEYFMEKYLNRFKHLNLDISTLTKIDLIYF